MVNADETLEINGPTAKDYPENGTDPVHAYTVTGVEGTVSWSLDGQDKDLFSINNGVVSFINSPDYEMPFDDSDPPSDQNIYLLSIIATDATETSKIEPVRIRVTNVNEPPSFPSTEDGRRTVSESAGANEDIGDPFQADDPDADGLYYTLGGTDVASFDIDNYTGQLKTATELDFETKSSYSLTVSVRDSKDGDGAADTVEDDSIDVTITVTDANDPPAFAAATGARTVAENMGAGENIGAAFTATDSGDTLTYSLGGTDAASFDLVTSSGQLQTKAALDYETKSSYTVTVSVRDSKDVDGVADTVDDDSIDVTITVTNVDEAGTVELSAVQPQIGTELTATLSDPDKSVSGTTWVWESSSDQTNWAVIVGATSAGYTPVDGDLGKYLRATATYTDGEGSGKSAEAVSANAVEAAPVTNSAPEFPSAETGARSVAENTGAGENIGAAFTATDTDNADTLTYSLGGTDAGSFTIVSTSGQLQTAVDLDYETKSSYTVTVSVRDSKDADGVADTVEDDSIEVTITVTNVDEAGTVTLSSDHPQVDSALTATLSDPDKNVSGTTWVWESSSDQTNWAVVSGATSASYTPVDGDLGKHLRATATYTDGEGSGKSAEAESATAVQAAPVTHDPPAFAAATGARAVAENTGAGVDIGEPVAAEDTDSGDTLTYTLGGTDAASFDLVTSSGQLQTKAALDYETKASYTVTVSVRNSKDADGVADTVEDDSIDVTITVTNVDEAGTVTLSADHPQVDSALTASLTDPDKNVSGTTWVWESSSDQTNWAVISGAASASYTPVDGDLGKYLQATATYTDGEGSGKSASAESANAVEAAPVTNSEPEFPSTETGARSVAENTGAGVNIGEPVTATDTDSGDALTYSLGGTDAASFTIVSTSGQLQTKVDLDYETKSSYTVTVSVRDSKDDSGDADTVEDDSIDVTITVTNVDEAGTVTLSADHPQVGTELTASVSDPDKGVSGTTWVWESSSDQTNWAVIVGATSAGYTPVEGDLDKYLRATATYDDGEGSGKSAGAESANATNKAPSFSADLAIRSVFENTAAGENIGTPFTAADADTLIYSLGGTDAASFGIVPGSGQLQTKAPLDFEEKSSYEVTVTATDPSGASDSITVTITVSNLDEAGTVELSTVQPQVETALTASLSDLDGNPSLGSWQWARGDSATGPFTNISGGASYTPVTADVGKYLRATATYTDPQGAGKSAIGVSANPVQAAPATNSTPVFSANAAARSVAENTVPETDFDTAITATDANNDTLTYKLGGTDADSFDIVTGSGQLQTKEPLDLEEKSSYEVVVTATDPSGASDSITVTISVSNLDEAGTVELSTVQPQVETALTATLTDLDGNPSLVSWQWARGDSATGPFTNVSSGATSSSYTPVAADVGKFLQATASYTDPQGSGKSASGVSANAVQAAPGTNSAPVFSANAAARSVLENAETGANIGTAITATDDDNDTLTYKLGGTDADSFSIVDTSGQLQIKDDLNYEETQSYTVTVTATDPSNAADTITVTINVDNVEEAGTVSLSATQPQVGTALTATLTDPDGVTTSVTWQWARSDTNGSYSNISSGASYTPVDADVGKHLRATATYTDPQGAGKSAHAVSDNAVQAAPGTNSAPEFSGNAATRSVDENAETGANIGTPVTATDANNDTLTYSLEGTDAASFGIVPGSGQLRTKLPLDYESRISYEVTVTATDPSGASDSITVTITVSNLDERGTVELSTVQPQVGTALTATLTDLDGNPSLVSWQWARSDTNGSYSNISSGASYTPVTADVGKYLRATASYADPQGGRKSVSGVSANAVLAAPGTNSAPVFSAETAARSVAENAALERNIGTAVAAADSDTLTYSLQGTDADSFGIVPGSGQLQTKASLNYEDKSSYEVTVTATDPSGASDSITVTITVSNLDEAGTVELSTVQPQVGTALTATLTDLDGNPSLVSWQWARSDTNGSYSNISSGASYTPVAADVGKFLQATASYTDPQGGRKSANAVSANAVQAAPGTNSDPEFSANTATRSVAENAETGANIGTPVTATDSNNDTLTYKLGGTDADSFSIVDTSGQLQTKELLDFEEKSSYEVVVTATDPSGAADTITVTINVENVEEAGTVALSAAQPQVGTALTATLSDPDGVTTSVTWQWARSGANGSYSDISSGASYTPVDADVDKFLKATASYTDPEGSGKSAAAVSASAVQPNALHAEVETNSDPVFSANTATRSVAENAETGANIGTPVTATDQDSGDTLTYALGGTDVGSFTIVSTSGQLQTAVDLDYETKPSYTVTMSVRDSKDDSGDADTADDDSIDVTITVTNVEEAGTVTLSSDHPQIGTELTASLSDPDGSVTGLTWQWASADTPAGAFTDIVGAASASYTPADGDAGKYLRATATYTDGEGSGKSAEAVSANATNKAPSFSADLAVSLVLENTAAGQDIGNPFTATDADTLTYSLGGTDAASFDIVPGSGQLQTKAPLDFEEKSSYEVVVTATDPAGAFDTIGVRITLFNLDEPGTVELSTVQPQVETALTATLSDLDGNPSRVSWQWARGDSATGPFTNVSGGAASSEYTPVTGDVGKYLQATATYTDPQGSGKTENAASENAVQAAPAINSTPVFSADTAARSVAENTVPETDFDTPVTATDANNDTLTYTLRGTDADSFDIVSGSGQLQTKAPLDFEEKSSYEVTVTATDPTGASDSITVTISVSNLDEAGTVDLSTVQPQVGTALTTTLTDLDGNPSLVSWQWARGDTATGPFTNVSSGATSSSYTPVTADVGKYLQATATYTDPQGPGKSAIGVSANAVQAAPGTNSAPVFSAETAARSVAENAAPERNIGTEVTAADADSDTLTYSLGGTDAASFDIVPGSGQLQTKEPLDFEEKSSYEVVVTSTDPSDASDSLTVTITVTNLDEAGTVELSTLQPQVETALTATLTDPDGVTTSVTWQWARSDTNGSYSNISSGASYTPVTADVGKFLQATASYTDPQRAGKGANVVSVNPVQAVPGTNGAPEFSGNTATRSVAENAETGANVGTPVTATDSDSDTLTYKLGGTDADSFSIVDTSGQLQTKASLNYEETQSYTVTVTATDPSDASDSITVTIAVANVDEVGTVELSTIQPQVGTALTAALTDPDGVTTSVTWQWARSGTNGSYSNISSGASYTPVAADVGKFLKATASYTDPQGSGKSADAVSANAVLAEPPANSDPSFPANTATRSVEENTPANRNIGASVAATDANSGDTLTYTLGGTDADNFRIVDTSGQVQTKDDLNYETQNSYTVTVSARDSKDSTGAADSIVDDSITVTITITNVDEAGTVSLLPAQPTVDTPLIASLSDPDGSPSSISWQWAKADSANGTFTNIGGATSASYTPVDGDLDKFLEATASYTDPEGSGKSAAAVSANQVQPIALLAEVETNSAPEFPSSETGTRSVAENTAAGQNIGTPVAATDDSGDRLTYTLGGTDASSFDINGQTGQLKVGAGATLNYEGTRKSYSVTVSVRDSKDATGAADSIVDANITVTITVTNLDEAGMVSLSSVQPQVGTALTATLSDLDGGFTGTTWQWARGDSATGPFTNVSGAGGASYTPVDADVGKYLRATATYTDPQGPGKSAIGVSANAVQALPATNSAPVFPVDADTRSVPENAAVGANVEQPVSATDPERKALTYSLETGTDANSFDIVQNSGQIQTKVALDYETRTTYVVTVRATDPGGLFDTIVVTINVVDVNEPPGRIGTPTLVPSSTDGHSNLMAKWTPPDNTGPVISGYGLKYAQQGTTGWTEAESSDTQEELSNLLPDTEYQAMVNAKNDEGAGSWSESGTGKTAPKPQAEWFNLTASFAASSYSVTEGRGRTIVVNLSPAADRRDSIPITAGGGANDSAEGTDYTVSGLTNGALPFVPGDTSVSFTIRANHDSDQSNETVTLSLGTPPTKVLAGTITSVTVTIRDDDRTPSPTPQPVPVPTPEPTPGPPTTGGGGGDDDDDDDDDGSGSGGSGGGGSGGGGIGTPGGGSTGDGSGSGTGDVNHPPYFDEGVTTERSVVEHTGRAAYLGDPVTATDPDGDVLTYALGGRDADSFALDSHTGQLITSAILDFELKPSYDVVMTVVDGRGAADAIEITIKVIDLTEVPIYSPQTQAAALVKPGEATTIETPDGAAAVTFPAQSRDGYYWARLDSASTRCGFDPGYEELQASLIVEFFDQWGTREHEVVLINPATVELRLDAESFGGREAVLAAHARGAFSVYAHNYTTLQWSQIAFSLAVDDEGRIIITISGLTSLDCFAVTTLAALLTPEQPVATPTPTPTPVPTLRGEVQPTPTPAPKAEPEPTPTVESEGIKIPLLMPQAVAEAGEVENPTPDAPDTEEQTEPTPAPVAMEAQLGPDIEDGGLAIWPILLMALGAALLAFSLWLFLSAKRRQMF